MSALAQRRAWWAYALLVAAYVVVRSLWFAELRPVAYRDSESYLMVASQSLLSADFWAGARSWTVPLLYKLLPDGDEARTIAQLVISLASWTALAAATARCVRPPAWRLVAFAIVLLFSMSFAVIRWDRLVLSESVSISLTAALVAAWLELARRPQGSRVVAVLSVTVLWVFTRDSNALLTALTALPALVWAVRAGPGARLWPVVLAAGLLATFAANLATTTTDEAQLRRNDRPMLHVVGRRVLVIPEQERYFRARGMPAPPPRVRRLRKVLAAVGDTIPSDPATDRFLQWVRDDGRRTLARYLVTHPVATLRPLLKFRRRLLSGVTEGYRSPGARPLLPRAVEGAVYPRRVRGVVLWLAIAIAAAAAGIGLRRGRRTWLVPAGLIALALPHAVLVYHGDTLEIARHSILVAITLRLGAVLLTVLALGALVERRLARRGDEGSAGLMSGAGGDHS